MPNSSSAAQEVRGELYEIVRRNAPFEEKAREALELGERYLGAENGHLTRIDQETDHWEAMASTDSPTGRFPPGLELDLETTYCRRTLAANAQIALHDAPSQGWADDPAFEAHGLHCYHGTTLVVDGEPYGTVCFVAEAPRTEPFSDGETMFAELITRLLERELEREQHQAELTRQANLATVLNRVLRHNLRNDMSVIRGYTQIMADELGDARYSEPAIRNIDNLIELGRKARKLDRIVAAEFDREPTAIVTLVERVVEAIAREYPSASVSVEYDDPVTAAVLPSFERSVEELVENAVKHSGENATVTITVETVPNAVEIRIADDGPGLAEHEADVLETGAETPLTHGSGLGLWLAHWIVTSHDGSVDATATEDGTTMTITVPRKSSTSAREQLTELTRARDQYQAAFEEASEAMIILNDDARIVDANSAASSVCGLERRALLGRSVSEFLAGEFDFEAAWCAFRNAGFERGHVTVVGDDVERLVEYAATADIVPGQHLVIGRGVSDRSR